MKNLGEAKRILGMDITRDRLKKTLSLSQKPKDEKEKEGMQYKPYASGVGSIMSGMVCSRPDLAYVLNIISSFMTNPGSSHWEALKWTLRYLKGTTDVGLIFKKQREDSCPVIGYVVADYTGNLETRKLITGYIFMVYGTALEGYLAVGGGTLHNIS
ncbi:secreted RxLR effector protein 161-like [Primulina tabacum]|uniref:secreted RxLR effector protein 161-like n=1 Tax=Primulina tabacum TaxID=48773 RepID=UPI003F595FDA